MDTTLDDIIEMFYSNIEDLNETDEFKETMLQGLLNTDKVQEEDKHGVVYRLCIKGYIQGYIMGYLESTLSYRIFKRFYINVEEELKLLEFEELKELINNLDDYKNEREVRVILDRHRIN